MQDSPKRTEFYGFDGLVLSDRHKYLDDMSLDSSLEQLCHYMANEAYLFYKDNPGHELEMVIVGCHDGDKTLMFPEFKGPEDKAQKIQIIKDVFLSYGVSKYVIATEAYMSTFKLKDGDLEPREVRLESLIVLAASESDVFAEFFEKRTDPVTHEVQLYRLDQGTGLAQGLAGFSGTLSGLIEKKGTIQ